MRTLKAFDSVSIDGYFTDAKGDIGWAHQHDPEWTEWVSGNARGDGTLVFGRVTYQMMASFWPTPAAAKVNLVVAERMNAAKKVVFSRTLASASWNATTLLKGDPAAEIRRLKSEAGTNMVLMGSGTIVSQLAAAGLIDEYQLVVVPVVLGAGRTLFQGVDKRVPLALKSSRAFSNGNVVCTYAPA